MARQSITVLTDDLDGFEADATVEFGLDGVTYTSDLSDKHAGKLRKVLDPYVTAGTKAGRVKADTRGRDRVVATSQANSDQNQAIREWAGRNGHEVFDRGRIPTAVVDEFNKAH